MQCVGLFTGQDCTGMVYLCLGIDGNVGRVGTKSHQSHHCTVGVCGAKISDRVTVINPLPHLLRVVLCFRFQLVLQLKQHKRPPQCSGETKSLFLKGLVGADMERSELLKHRCIRF